MPLTLDLAELLKMLGQPQPQPQP
ncbi:MAG: hypothetical protein JWP29_4916, partial [Rhodoferax sp.]|nr:hypothetical protein [Rhodoferax sp.]